MDGFKAHLKSSWLTFLTSDLRVSPTHKKFVKFRNFINDQKPQWMCDFNLGTGYEFTLGLNFGYFMWGELAERWVETRDEDAACRTAKGSSRSSGGWVCSGHPKVLLPETCLQASSLMALMTSKKVWPPCSSDRLPNTAYRAAGIRLKRT